MERRRTYASSFGFTAMLGGALFSVLAVLLTASIGSDASAPMANTANALIIMTLLLLAPGVVGVYFAHRDVFGRVETVVVAAHTLAILFLPLYTFLEFLLGTVPGGDLIGLVYLVFQLVGGVGTGVAIVYRDELANARLGGVLMIVAVLAVVGAGPLVEALGLAATIPPTLFAVLAFGPAGLAWLVVGYDLLTIMDRGVDAPDPAAAAED